MSTPKKRKKNVGFTKVELARIANQKSKARAMVNLRVQSFLYRLMREHLPPGKVELLIETEEQYVVCTGEFSNPHLSTYSKELAERLTRLLTFGVSVDWI